MSDVFLRTAAESDQPRIRQLVHQARINPMDLDWRNFIVAEVPGSGLIGCGQIKTHRDGSRELASIVVDEARRGAGVARSIIEHLMERVEPPLWLTCRSGLTSLYRKFGFREVAAEDPQPAYFRRIRRVAGALEFLSKMGEYLAVMVWEGEPAEGPAARPRTG